MMCPMWLCSGGLVAVGDARGMPPSWIQDREGGRAVNFLEGSTEVSKVCRFSKKHREGLAQARIAQGLDGGVSGLCCWDAVVDTNSGGAGTCK